ncbi:MAG TPA: response regulator transcription factor [Pyrinomonadaceae bacterium]|nr:response regulator transcription factor [Pyrinomonadaceae bacterium]
MMQEFYRTGDSNRDSKPLILVVEDDDDSRQMLKFMLETWDFSVLEAADGIEALTLGSRMQPNLILMDARLPGLDGFQVTKRIRDDAFIKDTPIFFITGCAELMYKKSAINAGANEYFTKPVEFDELKLKIDKYISREIQ